MTAKKAQTSTMILLVVPLGFSIGTELLKTIPHRSQTDFPIVNVGPPGSVWRERRWRKEKFTHVFFCVSWLVFYVELINIKMSIYVAVCENWLDLAATKFWKTDS